MGCISSKPQTLSSEYAYSGSQHSARSSESHAVSESSSQDGHYTGLVGPQSPRLSYHQQCLVGVARWPDPQYNREHLSSQMEYGQAFWQESRRLGEAIAKGRVADFDTLWDKARDWRVAISGGDEETFGDERFPTLNHTATTPLAGPYAYIKQRFNHRNDGELAENVDGSHSLEFPLREKLHDEDLLLSTVVLSTDLHASREDARYSHFRNLDLDEPFFIRHTFSTDVAAIKQHVASLFTQAIDPSLSKEQVMKHLANIHWWMANAMPDHRGSAAKTELCVRALAQARGLDLPPMKQGILADLEAMTTRRKDFVKNYQHFLDH